LKLNEKFWTSVWVLECFRSYCLQIFWPNYMVTAHYTYISVECTAKPTRNNVRVHKPFVENWNLSNSTPVTPANIMFHYLCTENWFSRGSEFVECGLMHRDGSELTLNRILLTLIMSLLRISRQRFRSNHVLLLDTLRSQKRVLFSAVLIYLQKPKILVLSYCKQVTFSIVATPPILGCWHAVLLHFPDSLLETWNRISSSCRWRVK
jgi:hypothetical protein